MAPLLGKHAIMEQFLADGVKYVFGNPGSTELAFMDGLQDYPQINYVLGLHETVAVGMADGYARAADRPGVVNVHIAPGLANAMSMVYNAWRYGTPLVITVGQQDSRFMMTEPYLSADLVRLAEPWSKWAAEITRADDLPQALRRAFKVAMEPPRGPVVLALPQDVLDHPVSEPIVPTSYTVWSVRPDPDAVERTARLLVDARKPIILVGDNMAFTGGQAEVGALAELVGAPVMAATSRDWNFPTTHPLYLGPLGFMGGLRESLAAYDMVLAIGTGNPFNSLWYEGGSPIPNDAAFVHIDVDTWQIGKNYPVTLGMIGDPKWAARDLHAAVERLLTPAARSAAQTRVAEVAVAKQKARDQALRQAQTAWNNKPISPLRLVSELRDVAPPHTAYVGAGGTSGRPPVAALLDLPEPRSFFEGGAALGFTLPGTLGVKLALPDRPVVGLLREGDSMYSIQGLWTAKHYNIPVTFVVFNNSSYRILKMGMVRYLGETGRKSEFIGLDPGEPAIDLARQAAAWDVPAVRVESPDDLRPALQQSLAIDGPSLVDVVIEKGYGNYF